MSLFLAKRTGTAPYPSGTFSVPSASVLWALHTSRRSLCYAVTATTGAMPMTLILSNDDVEKLLTMRECVAVMEEAYVELADGRGVSRTRSDCFTPTARADALYS